MPSQAERIQYNQWAKRQIGRGVDPEKVPDIDQWLKIQSKKKEKSGPCFIGSSR